MQGSVNRKLVFAVCLVVLGTVPVPVAADDLPDRCIDADTTMDPSSIAGSLTPAEKDVILLDIPEGESITIHFNVETPIRISAANHFAARKAAELGEDEGLEAYGFYGDNDRYQSPHYQYDHEVSFSGEDNIEYISNEVEDNDMIYHGHGENIEHVAPRMELNPGEGTFTIYSQKSDNICIVLETESNEVAGDFEFSTSTPTPTATPTPTDTATPTPTDTATDSAGDSTASPTDDNGGSGDDIQDSDGDGVIDSEDYAPNDPEVQEKSDLQDTSGGSAPGFGIGIALIALLVGALVVLRRSN